MYNLSLTSLLAREKGTSVCNKGKRRRLHTLAVPFQALETGQAITETGTDPGFFNGGVDDTNQPPTYMLIYLKLSYVCPKT